jgi:NADP-dependent 3-hydroxy acid dehydrogenase YdfG
MRAILTGHTHGLGEALATTLRARGIPVLGIARGRSPQPDDDGLTQVALDLADAAALARWLAGDALARFVAAADRVLLINNAGTLGPVAPAGRQGAAAIARAVALNVAAPLALTDAVIAATAHAAERRIVHISSGAARTPYAGWSIYCATKAALDQHARAVALDAPAGTRIVSLAPGVIDTAMQAQIRATPLADFPNRARFEALQRDGALLTPADCARRLIDYLLSTHFGAEPVADLRTVRP